MDRHEFLCELHRLVQPRTYLEIGVHAGASLALSRVPSVGIDPEFEVTHELRADIHLVRTTSDEFFAREHPLAHLPVPIIDLAFIDGMHLAEFALRDFLAVERFTTPASVIVFDDMLPRNVDEAARQRHTHEWTGDVFKAAQALRDLRPDLIVLEVGTAPTGVVVVLVPDAAQKGVLRGYGGWLKGAVAPDPQQVPIEILSRSRALDPEPLLESGGWSELAGLRTRAGTGIRAAVLEAFGDSLSGSVS